MGTERRVRRWGYVCAIGALGAAIGLVPLTQHADVKTGGVAGVAPAKKHTHNDARSIAGPGPAAARSGERARITQRRLQFPLSFEPNGGQAADPVKFLSRGPGYTLYVTAEGAALAFARSEAGRRGDSPGHAWASTRDSQVQEPPGTLTMRLAGANRAAPFEGAGELAGRSNYFIGSDPARWHRDVPNYSRVKMAGVYPGIDLVYYGNQRELEYDFAVAPGADPAAIALEFDTANRKLEIGNVRSQIGGLRIDSQGDLIVLVGARTVRLHKPVAYQLAENRNSKVEIGNSKIENRKWKLENRKSKLETGNSNPPRTPNLELRTSASSERRTFVDARYVLESSHRVGLRLAGYDRSRPLIIDPVLTYSTYLGGSGSDFGNGIAVDSSGAIYVTGETASLNFPPGSPAKSSCAACSANAGAADAFVTKLSADGSSVVYSTYLGGSLTDEGNGIAVDSAGNAYVVGTTVSTNFPTVGPFQATLGGGGPLPDAFVAKLDPTGSTLVYSTYLGGSSEDDGFGIAIDPNCSPAGSCAVYVAGGTSSVDFPVANSEQSTLKGGFDAFVAKLDPTGAKEVYSTYLGGTGQDEAFAVAVDGSSNAYVTGQTASNDFPTTNGAFQTAFGGNTNAFVAKLSFSGTMPSPGLSLAYSTYLGGSSIDSASGIAVDSSGSAYVAGAASSSNFPLQSPLQGAAGGGQDAFVAKFNPTGSALVYSTYLGGSGNDVAQGIAVDSAGRAHVAGFTTSNNFPLSGAVQTTNSGNQDAFVARLNPSGCALAFSTYLGGKAKDAANNIAVDSSGASYVVGTTSSNDFPIQSPLQAATGGGNDAFVAKMTGFTAPAACLSAPNITFSPQDVSTTSAAQKITLSNGGDATLNITSIVATGDFAQTNTCGTSLNAGASCTVNVTFAPTSFGARNGAVTVTDNAANSPQVLNLTGTGNDFGLSSNPATATISRGQSATFTVTLVASPSFTSQVSLSCSGAPPDGNCTVTPSSITPTGGSSTNATVTVTTVGPSMLGPRGAPRPTAPLGLRVAWPWLFTLIGLLLLASLAQAGVRRFPRCAVLRMPLLFAALAAFLLLWSGCGAGGGNSTPSSTPPGSYQLTFAGSADSGSLTHNIKVGLTVQ